MSPLRPQKVVRNVKWVRDAFGDTSPAWNSEPSLKVLETISRIHLHIPDDAPCSISTFAEGGFNKIYSIEANDNIYLIRVSLPVEPSHKTLSEIATIDFVRAHAFDLVPRVLAYNASTQAPDEEELGFEWMITERIPGVVLEECWNDMSWDAKVALVKIIAGVSAKLFDRQLYGIGNIYPETGNDQKGLPLVGSIVSMVFFWEDHFEQDVPRGPFSSSHDWLAAILQFILNDTVKILSPGSEADDDDKEEAEMTQNLARRLIELLPRLFPPSLLLSEVEPTIIHHDDISFCNVLVDDATKFGEITGLIDWECVSALPLWRACCIPSFLDGRTRNERPDIDNYATEENGKPSELYLEHLLEWEQTVLKEVFINEMEALQPEWVTRYRNDMLKRDFMNAVINCDSELVKRKVSRWVNCVELLSNEELQSNGGDGYKPLSDFLYLLV